jgi:hypothetical protein
VIDPWTCTPPTPHGFQTEALDVFPAHHLLLFGTIYTTLDYYLEAKTAVEAGAKLSWKPIWGPESRDEINNRHLREWVANSAYDDVVHLYLEHLGYQGRLHTATRTILAAAADGKLTVIGYEFGQAMGKPIPAEAFRYRGVFSITRGFHDAEDDDAVAVGRLKMTVLEFRRDEILELRAATFPRFAPPWVRRGEETLKEWFRRPEVKARVKCLFAGGMSRPEIADRLAESAGGSTGGKPWKTSSIERELRLQLNAKSD